MKILFTRTALVLVGLAALLSSCSKRPQSQKTGMTYNDKTNGGYELFKKTHLAPGPGLVPIEGGTFVMGGSADQDGGGTGPPPCLRTCGPTPPSRR